MKISNRDIKIKILNQYIMRIIYSIIFIFTFQSCKEKLDPLQLASIGIFNYGKVDARFCTSNPAPAQQKLKYLFIIDHSNSNKPGFTADVNDTRNTDADGSRRYGPMIDFINNLSVDPQTTPFFGLIDFGDRAYQPAGLNGFVSDSAAFLTVATRDWIGGGTAQAPSPNDSGFTNYQDALNLALTIIRQDAQSEAALQAGLPITSVYQIIFVSDGVPTILGPDGTLFTQDFTTDISPIINNILALKNNPSFEKYIASISLNTAYYFNSSIGARPSAITLLKSMASSGLGTYEQFATGQQILYQNFAPTLRKVVNQLVDVFVQNENAVWWDDGKFMMDSDGDGLPDIIEKKLGSNITRKDSDGNGINDLVEFRTKGNPCNDSLCSPSGRDPYAICAGYGPVADPAKNITFRSTSNDALNDCEKNLLSGKTESFNSNGNFIPDSYAVANNMSILPTDGTVALTDPFGDGMNNYQKLKLGLPIQISKKQTGQFIQRSSNLVVESSNYTGVTCYRLNVDNIALSGPQNTIKIHVIQNSSIIQDKAFLKTAAKKLTGATVSFSAEEFK